MSADDSLDAAWAEVEAALPKDWRIDSLERPPREPWVAYASAGWSIRPNESAKGTGQTPVAAMRSLAADLRRLR